MTDSSATVVPGIDASTAEEPLCAKCGKPTDVCVCDRTTTLTTEHDVLILQHPQEQDVVLGSAPLLLQSLPRARRVIGLSWPSLTVALTKAFGDDLRDPVDTKQWGVLFPLSLQRPLTRSQMKSQVVTLDKSGWALPRHNLRGVVALDGTWSQVKTLWWRNAWLLKLGRVVLHPQQPSIYGRLRREPQRHYLSTLESVALTLDGLGEKPATSAQLLRLFRTMLQRARQRAQVQAEPRSTTTPTVLPEHDE